MNLTTRFGYEGTWKTHKIVTSTVIQPRFFTSIPPPSVREGFVKEAQSQPDIRAPMVDLSIHRIYSSISMMLQDLVFCISAFFNYPITPKTC